MSKKQRQNHAKFIDDLSKNNLGQKKYKRKSRYPYRLYIPQNLDIDEVLSGVLGRPGYHRDNFVYISHLIVSIPSRLKDYDFEKNHGYTPIDKKLLSRRMHNYKNHIDIMVEYAIVEEGTSYMPSYYSRGLRFTPTYRVEVKGVYITKNTLIKSITEIKDNRDIEAEAKLFYLKKWFNKNLTIDMEMTKAFLELDKEIVRAENKKERSKKKVKKYEVSIEDIVTMGYNMKFMVADKINHGNNLSLTVDNTTGRFHSPLTQLKSGLRKYVSYDNESLWGIDIVNSQPLLVSIVLDFETFKRNEINKILARYNTNFYELKDMDKLSKFNSSTSTMLVNLLKKSHQKKDVQHFKKAVTDGVFYEFFGDLLLQKGLIPAEIISNPKEIRGFAKKAIFTAFFSEIIASKWNEYVIAFDKCFPNVARIFKLIKQGKDKHNTLACLLQRFESNLMLHEVCWEIATKYPHIPLFTVHDSIVTTKANVKIVEEIFRRNLQLKLGANPQLKIEEW